MVTARRGASSLGCLFSLLILVAVGYFGYGIGEVYVRSYRFNDGLTNQAKFAKYASDDEIRKRLRSLADSLGLPEEAGQIKIRRSANRITISTTYSESLELPGFVRVVSFSPSASAGL